MLIMEDSKEKRQNNRKEDEKRDQNSGNNSTSIEREWDPAPEDGTISHKEKLKTLKSEHTKKIKSS